MGKEDQKIADIITIEGVDCKGFGIIAKLVTTDTNLSIGAKALYAYLCSYAGSGTTAYPRRGKILADLKMSKETYYKHLNEVLDQGYIKATRGNKYPFANTYTIVNKPPKLQEISIPDNENEDILIAKGIKSMGYGTVPKAVMLDERLHYKAKALYAYFCSFAGNGTTAFPRRDTICHHMQFTINSFQRYIRQLIKYNYIEVQQTTNRGRFSNNVYFINDLPDENVGKQEMERRNAIQERKVAARKGGQAEKTEGVNIDTPNEKRIKSSKTEVSSSKKSEKMNFAEKAEADHLMEERGIYAGIIKENIEYDFLRDNQDESFRNLLDVVYNIMVDTVCSTETYIKIGKSEIPQEVLKSQFLKLDSGDVEYVIEQLLNTTTKIVNIPAYIRTCLYHAKTNDFYWHNQVKSDMG